MNVIELENINLKKELAVLQDKLAYLEEQLTWCKNQIFGKKSEKIIQSPNENVPLLPGFEECISNANKEPEGKKPDPEKKKRKYNKKGNDSIVFPDDLPVEQIIIDISEEEKICPITGKALIEIGREIVTKIAKRSGSYFIKEYVRIKYAMPKGAEEGIKVANLPDTILPKCQVDDSILADILCKKFADHLPLYRINEIYQREGVYISRQLMSQWVIQIGSKLELLYNALLKDILNSGNIYIDETPLDLLAPGKGKTHQAFMWVIAGGRTEDPPDRIFHFSYNRKADNAHNLLSEFKGVFHSDKYSCYVQLAQHKDKIWCPCWAHIRRKFVEAETGDIEFRNWCLRKIKYLFMLDRVAWARPEEERLRIRQEKSIPIIDELTAAIKDKLISGKILPKSKYKEALGYFMSLIPYLKNYAYHPYARLDNNVVERAIRPLTIGRKNWLFVGSMDGGKAAAILLSLIQTCRGYSINPCEYLEDIFRRIMSHSNQKLEELLPKNWKKSS